MAFDLQVRTSGAAMDLWKSHLSTQSSLLNATRVGNWISFGAAVANHFAIRAQTEAISTSIQSAAQLQIDAARSDAQYVAETVREVGTALTESVNELASLLDTRLALVVDQLRVGNALSRNIVALLRIPDFQKERQYYIEQGLKHYSNARLDNALMEQALRNLLEAETREPTDYLVLLRIGLIYLYSPTLLDLPKSEEYLRRATRYAVVESHEDAERVASLFDVQTENPVAPHASDVRRIAADISGHCSVSCLAQAKDAEALAFAQKAVELDPYRPVLQLHLLRAAVANASEETKGIADAFLRLDSRGAAALADDNSLLSDIGVQQALSEHANRLRVEDVEYVKLLREHLISIPSAVLNLVSMQVANLNSAVAHFEQARSNQRHASATKIKELWEHPNPATNLGHEALVMRVPNLGTFCHIALSNSGELVAVVSATPKKVNVGDDSDAKDFHLRMLTIRDSFTMKSVQHVLPEVNFSDDDAYFHNLKSEELSIPPDDRSEYREAGYSVHEYFTEKHRLMAIAESFREAIDHWAVLDTQTKRVVRKFFPAKEREYLADNCVQDGLLMSYIYGDGLGKHLCLWDMNTGQRLHEIYLDRPADLPQEKEAVSIVDWRVNASRTLLIAKFSLHEGREVLDDSWTVLYDLKTAKVVPVPSQEGFATLFAFDRYGQVLTVAKESALGRRAHSAIVNRNSTLAASFTEEKAEILPVPESASLKRFLTVASRSYASGLSPLLTPTDKKGGGGIEPLNGKAAAPNLPPSKDACDAFYKANVAQLQEDRKSFFRKKDFTIAIVHYQRAKDLGHPQADLMINALLKRMQK